jgi:Na+/H+ antiporter NhaC
MILLISFVLSGIIYWFLQDKEDKKADASGTPRASLARRVGLWAILYAVILVLAYLANSAFTNQPKCTDEVCPLPDIREEVRVGIPPFK